MPLSGVEDEQFFCLHKSCQLGFNPEKKTYVENKVLLGSSFDLN